jgi:hypothetical protein
MISQEGSWLSPMNLDEQQLWSIFEPLLELKRLEYLFYGIPLPVSDQKTARIACAWPHIQDLSFPSAPAGGLSSLESLAHFARHCPDLETLNYQIDFQTITTIPPTHSPHPLHTFNNNGCPGVMQAPAIALGLHQIFPNLELVDGDGEGWTLVQDILDSFDFLRNQNRQFKE